MRYTAARSGDVERWNRAIDVWKASQNVNRALAPFTHLFAIIHITFISLYCRISLFPTVLLTRPRPVCQQPSQRPPRDPGRPTIRQ